jgi:hypothetical protein
MNTARIDSSWTKWLGWLEAVSFKSRFSWKKKRKSEGKPYGILRVRFSANSLAYLKED